MSTASGIWLLVTVVIVLNNIFINCQKCDGIEPCVPMGESNARFRRCCEKAHLDTCAKYCAYDTQIADLKRAVLKTKECFLYQVKDFLKCASENKDNTPCCQKTNVLDGSRALCHVFCNPNSKDYPKTKKGAGKYLKCLQKFNQIMKCHHASLRP